MAHEEGQHHPATGEPHAAVAVHHEVGQHHPLGIYFKIWGLLFVLSAASYAVDYFHIQGYLRWFLILTFMMLKAGLIVAVFMHMVWERLALVYAILVPPLLLGTLVWIGVSEGDYTFLTRGTFFGAPPAIEAPAKHHK
jgi:cytochrome c oxidase subunit IV